MKDYPTIFPQLPVEIFLFFSEKPEGETWTPRTVIQFCSYYYRKHKTDEMPQPRTVAAVCDRLVEAGKLSVHSRGGIDSTDNRYFALRKDKAVFENEDVLRVLNIHLGFIAYGFQYIYEYY